MRGFVLPSAPTSHRFVRALIGRDWLRRRVERLLQPRRLKKGFTRDVVTRTDFLMEHPIVSDLHEVRIGRRDRPIRTDFLEHQLRQVATIHDPRQLRARLRDSNSCEKVTYELAVEAGFARMGFEPHLVPAVPRKRTPEFFIEATPGARLWVECKKKDSRTSLERKMDAYRARVDHLLVEQLRTRRLNFYLRLKFLSDPSGISEEDFVARTVNALPTEGRHVLFEDIELTAVKLCDPGDSVSRQALNLFPVGRQRSVYLTLRRTNEDIDWSRVQDPLILSWDIPDDFQGAVKGLITSFKDAARQIPQSGPGAVYIDVNCEDYEEERELMVAARSEIKDQLAESFSRVNIVVITSMWPSQTLDDLVGWRIAAEPIQNPHARAQLPKGTLILGEDPPSKRSWLPGKWVDAS